MRGRAESRHNLAYWRYGDYAGIGPGAHGRVTVVARCWRRGGIARRSRGRSAWSATGTETAEEAGRSAGRAREMLLMGLRLTEGVEEMRFLSRAGIGLHDALDPVMLRRAEEGYVRWTDGRLSATQKRGR